MGEYYTQNTIARFWQVVHSTVLVVGAIMLVGVIFFAKPVQALGVGGVSSESYIGEALSASIPLFNIARPDTLEVELETDAFKELLATVDRSNSQLAIRINSLQVINEPYLNFTLKLTDNGNTFSKEFVVLLDLSPSGVSLSENQSSEPEQASFNGGQVPSVMGPYDWAEQGRVAKKFGAVLDGQSLWRVARRINKALGVSLNQMMWSLYQTNPQAFSGRSISTLRAGAFLNIPSAAEVSQFSDSQAQAKLDSLSDVVATKTPSPAPAPESTAKISSTELEAVNQSPPIEQALSSEEPVSTEPATPFQLTGIDQAAQSKQSSTFTADPKSQEIISSLAQTVGDLTQELIRKDKKIAFLEEKVEALRGLERVDSVVLSDSANLDAAALKSLSGIDSPVVAEINSRVVNDDRNWFQRWWLALLGVLAAMCGLIYVFRERLAALYKSLNLFGNERDLEFERSHMEYDQEVSKSKLERNGAKNYSVMKALKEESQDGDLVKGISFTDFAGYIELGDVGGHQASDEGDGDSFDDDLEVSYDDGFDGEHDGVYEDLDEEDSEIPLASRGDTEAGSGFSEQFDELLINGNYDRARELLDAARYKHIDEGRYHCERLQMLYNKKSTDGFYNYFYSIESKIESFEKNDQTRISQMLVSLWA